MTGSGAPPLLPMTIGDCAASIDIPDAVAVTVTSPLLEALPEAEAVPLPLPVLELELSEKLAGQELSEIIGAQELDSLQDSSHLIGRLYPHFLLG